MRRRLRRFLPECRLSIAATQESHGPTRFRAALRLVRTTSMSATLRLSLGQHSEAGRKPINQDFHGAVLPRAGLLHSKGAVLALADGIGSSAVGHVASEVAVRGFLSDYFCTPEAWTVRHSAARVLQAINAWLHAQSERGDGRLDKDLGYVCTFSALVFKGRDVHLLHVGDARVCRVHAAALEPLSEDHRVRVADGQMLLARALGVGASVDVDYACWRAEVGETYLLATDGVHEHLPAGAVRAAIDACAGDLQAAAQRLVAQALAAGSPDNLSVQLVRIEELPEAEAGSLRVEREGLMVPPLLRVGQSFEGCEIVRELHASARSHVYVARPPDGSRPIVLKIPSVDRREDPSYLDGFVREEWVARQVRNPHLLRAAVWPRPRQHLFAAMEYVEGHTLAQWMIDHPRPDLDAVRRLVEQIAAGLQALHARDMLHQDLRPDNVIVDDAGMAKIIDFAAVHVAGLAEGTDAPEPSDIVGELQYTAPEYFVGAGGSSVSDLFSLATITYEMLTGRLPYGLQVPQVRHGRDLQRLRYAPLRTLRDDLPAWLDEVLRKALQPQPGRRHDAVSEFLHELRSRGAGVPTTRRTPVAQRDPLRFWQGLSLLLALLVVALLAVLVKGG